MTHALAHKIAMTAFFGALYIGLFWLTHKLVGIQGFDGLVSLLFLPAFVRLIAFLVIGFWSIPLLFFAGYLCILIGWYDIAPGNGVEMSATLAMAFGAPLGTWVAMQVRRVQPDLIALSPIDLLWLSIGCSLGNALLQSLALYLALATPPHLDVMAAIFWGDTMGTWVTILLVRAGLLVANR